MDTPDVLRSTIDKSINLVVPLASGGSFESRFVQRQDDTAIVYLSSMSGCDLSCRFCWLTQLGQTEMAQASLQDYAIHAGNILDLAIAEHQLTGITTLHYNFMARGDVLSNATFRMMYDVLFKRLVRVARQRFPKVVVKFKLSTIFPNSLAESYTPKYLKEVLVDGILDSQKEHDWEVEFYYSLYSLRPEFRKKWLPKALDPELIGAAFRGRDYGLRIHHALISGVNDSEEDVALIHDWLERHNLHVMFNLVRYNPHSLKCGEESDAVSMRTYLDQLALSHRVTLTQVIPLAGRDVFASCGMFVDDMNYS